MNSGCQTLGMGDAGPVHNPRPAWSTSVVVRVGRLIELVAVLVGVQGRLVGVLDVVVPHDHGDPRRDAGEPLDDPALDADDDGRPTSVGAGVSVRCRRIVEGRQLLVGWSLVDLVRAEVSRELRRSSLVPHGE